MFTESELTSSSLFNLLGSLDGSGSSLFFLLFSSAPMKVLHDDSNKHVENKETNQEQERYEVEQPPLIVVLFWLKFK